MLNWNILEFFFSVILKRVMIFIDVSMVLLQSLGNVSKHVVEFHRVSLLVLPIMKVV